MKRISRALPLGSAGLLLLAAASCGGLEEVGAWRSSGVEVRSVLPENGPATGVLGAMRAVAALTAAEAEARLPEARETFEENGTDEARLLVLLLTLRSGPDETRDVRTMELLDAAQAVPRAATPNVSKPEALLRDLLGERLAATRALRVAETRRTALDGELQEIDELLGADQERQGYLKALLEGEREKARAIDAQLEEERARAEALEALLGEETRKVRELQGQIEQLKTIEKIIDHREEQKAVEVAE